MGKWKAFLYITSFLQKKKKKEKNISHRNSSAINLAEGLASIMCTTCIKPSSRPRMQHIRLVCYLCRMNELVALPALCAAAFCSLASFCGFFLHHSPPCYLSFVIFHCHSFRRPSFFSLFYLLAILPTTPPSPFRHSPLPNHPGYFFPSLSLSLFLSYPLPFTGVRLHIHRGMVLTMTMWLRCVASAWVRLSFVLKDKFFISFPLIL